MSHPPSLSSVALEDASVAQHLLTTNPILAEKIATALRCSLSETPRALHEVLRFLFLSCQHGRPLTPSHVIDLAWHEWILFTRAYTQFCQAQFGRYMHHTPGGRTEENLERYQLTLQLYEARFGTPDPNFWPPVSSDCGACETLKPT
ncbi:MAG: hypothetical protein CMJ59_24145 [Planctomycetaceae bacterium]|nr:hypothetical protein [Planctomycetaceae bacterium]